MALTCQIPTGKSTEISLPITQNWAYPPACIITQFRSNPVWETDFLFLSSCYFSLFASPIRGISLYLKIADGNKTQCVRSSPNSVNLPKLPIGPLESAEPKRFFSYKTSTVYLNLIPAKIHFSWSENAEVAFTDNSWRTLALCLSFSLPRVENSAVQTGSRHTPHTAQYENAGTGEQVAED